MLGEGEDQDGLGAEFQGSTEGFKTQFTSCKMSLCFWELNLSPSPSHFCLCCFLLSISSLSSLFLILVLCLCHFCPSLFCMNPSPSVPPQFHPFHSLSGPHSLLPPNQSLELVRAGDGAGVCPALPGPEYPSGVPRLEQGLGIQAKSFSWSTPTLMVEIQASVC